MGISQKSLSTIVKSRLSSMSSVMIEACTSLFLTQLEALSSQHEYLTRTSRGIAFMNSSRRRSQRATSLLLAVKTIVLLNFPMLVSYGSNDSAPSTYGTLNTDTASPSSASASQWLDSKAQLKKSWPQRPKTKPASPRSSNWTSTQTPNPQMNP